MRIANFMMETMLVTFGFGTILGIIMIIISMAFFLWEEIKENKNG